MNKLLTTAVAAVAALPLAAPALPAMAAPAPHVQAQLAGVRVGATHGITTSAASVTATASPDHGTALDNRLRHRRKRFNGTSTSVNWAGYAQAQPKGSVKSISASVVVPTVAASPSGYASTWVGIDGLSNQWLVQTGISEEAIRGRTYYYAWWEVITPTKVLPEQRFTLALKPGQRVTPRVTLANGKATMSVFNNQTGRSASRTYAYAGPTTSAEWIQEDVYIDGRVSPAPNWNQVTFTSATRNNASPKLDYKQSIDIVDGVNTKETRTSTPNVVGNGFSVKWLAAGHWTSLS